MKCLLSAALVSSLALLAPAVRKPGRVIEAPNVRMETYSKTVSMIPGADGQLHSYTREAQRTRLGDEINTVVRECKDGECRERRAIGAGAGQQVRRRQRRSDMLSRVFDAPRSPSRTRSVLGLADLDVFNDVFEGLFNGFGGVMPWPSVDWAVASPQPDSVTRTVEITLDENGQRQRKEVIHRRRNGKVTTEVIHDGPEEKTPKTLEDKKEGGEAKVADLASAQPAVAKNEAKAEVTTAPLETAQPAVVRGEDAQLEEVVDAATKRRAALEVEDVTEGSDEDEDVLDLDAESTGSAASVKEKVALKTGATEDGPSGDLATKLGSADVAPPKHENVVRTVVIREVNGKREEVETIERCKDGKCTKEVRRTDPDGKTSTTVEEYDGSVQEKK